MRKFKRVRLADLLVADSVKAVIQGFLEAECTPTILLSPLKAEGVKSIILGEIFLSLSQISSSHHGDEKTTKELAKRLRAVASAYSRDGRFELCFHFRTLSWLLESVIS